MRLKWVVVMALATMLLSGCFRYQSTMVVAEDGSGVVQELLVVDRSAVESLFESDTDVEAHLPRAADLALPSWVVVRDYAADGFEGVVMDIRFAAPSQFNDRLNTLHRILAATIGSTATSNVELHQVHDGWAFSMQTADLADVPARPGSDPSNLSDLYHAAELVIALRLPGRVVDHNADEYVDGQLVWRLSAQSVQTQLYARSSTSGALVASARNSRALQVATAAATVGGFGVFAAVAFSRRRNGGPGSPPPGPTASLGEPMRHVPGPPSTWPDAPPAAPPVRQPPPHAGPAPPA